MRIAIASVLALWACGTGGGKAEETTEKPAPAPVQEKQAPAPPAPVPAANAFEGATQLVWRFHDSSVPPQYHRSYVITVTPISIRKVVDSYGKVLGDETAPFDQARFDAVLAAVTRHALATRPAGDEHDGCTGGTSHALEIRSGEEVILRGEQGHCGGTDAGSLTGDARGFDAELTALAPAAGQAATPTPTPTP